MLIEIDIIFFIYPSVDEVANAVHDTLMTF